MKCMILALIATVTVGAVARLARLGASNVEDARPASDATGGHHLVVRPEQVEWRAGPPSRPARGGNCLGLGGARRRAGCSRRGSETPRGPGRTPGAKPGAPGAGTRAAEGPGVALVDEVGGERIADFGLPPDYGTGLYRPGAISVTRDVARSGRGAVKITVTEGDVASRGDDG